MNFNKIKLSNKLLMGFSLMIILVIGLSVLSICIRNSKQNQCCFKFS